jgi:hypothetical protein
VVMKYPHEMSSFLNWRNPIMELGSRYKDMATFRLATYETICHKKFELGIEYTSPIKYRGYCKGVDCPWSIHAMEETKGSRQSVYVSF